MLGEASLAVLVKGLLERAMPAALAKIGNHVSKGASEFKFEFSDVFRATLINSFKRSRFIKTVVSKDQAVDLEDIYVPLLLSNGEQGNIPDYTVNPTAALGQRFVISATGGAGKTVLMKHLLNESADNKMGLIPLFFEMRNLDFSLSDDLSLILLRDLALEGTTETQDVFTLGLDDGLFAIFLDGFDEVKPDWQPLALKRIDSFSRRFEHCSIIISTRPKSGIENLADFHVYHINPLNKEQALSVVQRTPFEEITKDKFYKALDLFLYEKHQTMMSIPILVAMMLLTFRSYADIPDRMTVFYAQAYNTLSAIHDSEGKLQFKREYRSGLAPDLFRNVLEAFCYLSLKNHDIEFTHNSFLDYIGKAIKLARVDCAPASYADDLIQNVCIVQPDGITYVFVHRSFQEYFAACFALNYSGANATRIVSQITDPHSSTSALMMNEIDPAKFKRIWLMPLLDELAESFTSHRDSPLYLRLGIIVSRLWIEDKRLVSLQFHGNAGMNFDKLQRVSVFCPRTSPSTLFTAKEWINDKSFSILIDLAADDTETAFVSERISEDKMRYLIDVSVDTENWLSTTGIHHVLDNLLSAITSSRDDVRSFLAKQDDVESEILEI